MAKHHKPRKLASSQRRITQYFAARRTLTRAETKQIYTLLSRADTIRILERPTRWMDMTPDEQTESVQANSSFRHHFC